MVVECDCRKLGGDGVRAKGRALRCQPADHFRVLLRYLDTAQGVLDTMFVLDGDEYPLQGVVNGFSRFVQRNTGKRSSLKPAIPVD